MQPHTSAQSGISRRVVANRRITQTTQVRIDRKWWTSTCKWTWTAGTSRRSWSPAGKTDATASMAPNMGRFLLQRERHGLPPGAKTVVEHSAQAGAASGVSYTEKTTRSSTRHFASMAISVARFSRQREQQGVSPAWRHGQSGEQVGNRHGGTTVKEQRNNGLRLKDCVGCFNGNG